MVWGKYVVRGTLLFITLILSPFARGTTYDEPKEKQPIGCSEWINNASNEEYERAFEVWHLRMQATQTWIDNSRSLVEVLPGASAEFRLAQTQLEAMRLLGRWYNELVHLGGLAGMENLSADVKERALLRALEGVAREKDKDEAGREQLEGIVPNELPSSMFAPFSRLKREIKENGLAPGPFAEYLEAAAQYLQLRP